MCKTRGISWLAEETVTFERRLSRFGVGCKSGQVQFKYRSDNSNERGNWSNLKIIQKIPEQHNGKARNQGATEKKNHFEHCTHTAGNTDVKLRNIQP